VEQVPQGPQGPLQQKPETQKSLPQSLLTLQAEPSGVVPIQTTLLKQLLLMHSSFAVHAMPLAFFNTQLLPLHEAVAAHSASIVQLVAHVGLVPVHA
jgi:hypothetical protein